MAKDSVGRIPSLDGLRAIAIALLLYGHSVASDAPALARQLAHVAGTTGVRLFFVLSGFLITTLLLRELGERGRISLKAFYWRRTFRIFPAFYTYVGTLLALVALGRLAIPPRDLVFAATYTMNFHEQRAWWVGHLWSLAVEEQFYLLWPFTLVVLGVRRALWGALGAIAAAPALRVGAFYLWPSIGGLTDQAFPFVCDALAMGCVLALTRAQRSASSRYRGLIEAPWFWVVPALCLAPTFVTRPWIELPIAMSLANLGLVLAVDRCVTRREGPLRRILEHPAVVWVGTLSYSLYLWQQPFLNRHSFAWFNRFPVNLGLAAACAVVSYLVVERPGLKLGRALGGGGWRH